MSLELTLIGRMIEEQDFPKEVQLRLTPDHFLSPEGRPLFNYVKAHHRQFQVLPSFELVQQKFPRLQFPRSVDPVTALAEQVHSQYVYNEINLMAERVAATAAADPIEAAKLIAKMGGKFRAITEPMTMNQAMDIVSSISEEREEYYRRKNCKGVLGFEFPWPRMNQATFGIQPGNLLTFYARPKSMKTWVLLYLLVYLHYRYSKRIMIFTREMTKVELRRRIVALYAGLDYDHYVRGRLATQEEKRWSDMLDAFSESESFIIETVEGTGEEAAESMILKAQEYQAEIMAVDGIYFFGDREWDLIAKFTSRLKRGLIDQLNIPCLSTTQQARSKKGDTGDDVGYGDSILQDADMLVKCQLFEEENRIMLSMPGVRESRGCDFQIWAKPASDFSQAPYESEDDQKAREKNDDVIDPLSDEAAAVVEAQDWRLE